MCNVLNIFIGHMHFFNEKVGVKCLETGVFGAYYNVLTNLKDIKDDKYKAEVGT